MTHEYEIPEATVAKSRPMLQIGGVVIVIALSIARHVYYIEDWAHYGLITWIWATSFTFVAAQWLVSWREKPYTATPSQQSRLDRMRVTVNVPVYNEEPVILDRVIYALFAQTRLAESGRRN